MSQIRYCIVKGQFREAPNIHVSLGLLLYSIIVDHFALWGRGERSARNQCCCSLLIDLDIHH